MGWIHEQNKMTDEIGQLKIKNRELEKENENLRDRLLYYISQNETGNPIPWDKIKKELIEDGLYKP